MALYRTEALILRSRKYLEADSLLTLLTKKKGKISAIAKGVRKPNSRLRGGVQLFTLNDVLLHEGRNLDIVTQSQSLEAFTLLQENYQAMAMAAYWGELLDAFAVEGEADSDLYNLALAGFHILCLAPVKLTMRALEIKLLAQVGYTPCLERCVYCGKELTENMPISFSSRLGGVLCHLCTQTHEASKTAVFSFEALNVWQQLLKMELAKIGRLKLSKRALGMLENTIGEFLLEQTEYPLKSRAIMQEMVQDD